MFSCLYQQFLHHPPQALYKTRNPIIHILVFLLAQTTTIVPFSPHLSHLQFPSVSTAPQFLLYSSNAHYTSISSSSSLFSPTFSCPQPSLPSPHCHTPGQPAHMLCTLFPFCPGMHLL